MSFRTFVALFCTGIFGDTSTGTWLAMTSTCLVSIRSCYAFVAFSHALLLLVRSFRTFLALSCMFFRGDCPAWTWLAYTCTWTLSICTRDAIFTFGFAFFVLKLSWWARATGSCSFVRSLSARAFCAKATACLSERARETFFTCGCPRN